MAMKRLFMGASSVRAVNARTARTSFPSSVATSSSPLRAPWGRRHCSSPPHLHAALHYYRQIYVSPSLSLAPLHHSPTPILITSDLQRGALQH